MSYTYADIPNVWWPSFSVPGPLVNVGTQESPASQKDLADRQKKLKKKLNAANSKLNKARERLRSAHPNRRVMVNAIGSSERGVPFDQLPLDKLVFGVQTQTLPEGEQGNVPASFRGGWIKPSSQQGMARASVEHSKILTEIVDLTNQLAALNEEAKGE